MQYSLAGQTTISVGRYNSFMVSVRCVLVNVSPSWVAVLLIAITTFHPSAQGQFDSRSGSVSFYVSPNGSDNNPGTDAKPFATLTKARAAVHQLRPTRQAGGVTVWVHGGLYVLSETFALDSEDSGTADSPVVYRAVEGETPRIFGGVRVAGGEFGPVSDPAIVANLAPEARGHVVQAKLSAAAGTRAYPDFFRGNGGLFRLLMDDRVMPLSRWPNSGYTTMESVIESGITPVAGGTFVYREEVASHAERWKNAIANGRLWLTGFWRVPFEVSSIRVARMDSAHRTMTFAAPNPNGIGSKYVDMVNGTRHGSGKEQYYASNLVEEIDRPGEWSYDFKTQTIFFWPPSAGVLEGHELLLANLNDPVISVEGAKYVTLQGLTVEGSIHEGIRIKDGGHDTVAGCVIRNTGGGGVDVEGGIANRVQSNDLLHLGSYGIRLVAGDRKRLIAGDATADNNHIFYIGEQERITEGVYLGGVGNKATHNLIHDAPYNGINYAGNDQYMALNEIHHIGLDAGDLGIFYTNGDWAAQGNRIEHNFGHDSPNANGSYIDDGASGRSTVGNVFYKLASGIFMGGGHNNLVEGNLIVDCRIGIHIDNRGVARHYDSSAKHLVNTLQTIDPNAPPWSTRYPNFLKGIVEDPTQPTNNTVIGNALVGDSIPYQLNAPAAVDHDRNPVIASDPGFMDVATLDLRLKSSSAIRQQLPAFPPIPMAEIGLYRDAYRLTLPTDAETGRMIDRNGSQSFDSNVDVKASDRIAAPKP
jgi:hypothetical protein